MEETYWKQFENSGRIEDYLSFRSCTHDREKNAPGSEEQDTVKSIQCPGGQGTAKLTQGS